MSLLKILTDLCTIRQKISIKNTFVDILNNVLLVKKSYKSRKKLLEKWQTNCKIKKWFN